MKFTTINYITLLFTLLVSSNGMTQSQHESCGFDYGMEKLMSIKPYADRVLEMEKEVASFVGNMQTSGSESVENITIPIVFHVLYENPSENVTDAKIIEQVDLLNEYFNATNTN